MSLELARSHIDAQARIKLRVRAGVRAAWVSLGSYDEADVEVFLARALPLIRAGELASISALQSFLGRSLGRPVAAIDPAGVVDGIRNGAAPEEVYRRPFVETWTALKNGTLWEQAVQQGLERAVSAASTDLQLAMTHGAKAFGGADDGIYGYQRVANSGACDLCLIASTQRYFTDTLMPIHNYCNCGVSAITEPTGQIINRGRYTDLKSGGRIDALTKQRQAGGFEKRAASSESRADRWRREAAEATDSDTAERYALRAQQWQRRADEQAATANGLRESARANGGVEVRVREHGELGPVLTNADHSFDLHA